jgi:imidazolonepropionase-like amidohydrolase
MRRSRLPLAGLAGLLLTAGCTQSELRSELLDDPLVIRNAHVATMDSEEILRNRTIVITGGRIEWIGEPDAAVIPDGSRIVEGEYYVMPGLAEMHGHIPGEGQGRQYAEDVLTMFLAQGVTFVRGMAGNPLHLELREDVERGRILSPRIIAAGPSFSGGSAPDVETAHARVREQVSAGYDLLKIATGMTREVFDAVAAESNAHNLEFSGHIPYHVGLERALEARYGTIDHLDRYMEYMAGEAAAREDPPTIWFGYDLTPHVEQAAIRDAARATIQAGVGNVPTNTLLENVFNPDLATATMRQWPGMEYLPRATVDSWTERIEEIRAGEAYDPDQARRFLQIRKDLTRALYAEGPDLLLLGADAPQMFNPPGFSIHRELAIKVDAGLTPYQALRTGTVNVARYLGEDNESGRVLPGYRADLLLLSVNPLETLPFGHAIEGVVRDGAYLSRTELDELLAGVRQRVD